MERKNHLANPQNVAADLVKKGFSQCFELEGDALKCTDTGKKYEPQQIEVVEQYRFEGTEARPDNTFVYAVKCNDGTQGMVVSMYGMLGSVKINQLMQKAHAA